MPANYTHDLMEMMFFKRAPAVGQITFTADTYWTVPVGVTNICAVTVGASVTRVTGSVTLCNSVGFYGTEVFVGSGGNGGASGSISSGVEPGGGGAGGYTGHGGAGGNSGYSGSSGSGGGGGGGSSRGGADATGLSGYPGGGVGLLGQGSSGAGGTYAFTDGGYRSAGLGGGGSGGGVGALPGNSYSVTAGGSYGGGKSFNAGRSLRYVNSITVTPGEQLYVQMDVNGSNPAARILWGGGRSFPSNAGDM